MTPIRRYLSMATGAITIILLGFVVAVAARSRPGISAEDPLFEMNSRFDLDIGRLFAWLIVVMTVLGAVLFALGLKQSKPRNDQRKRSYLGLFLGVVAFFLIFRYIRPLADNLLSSEAVSGTEEAVDQVAPSSTGSSGWLFSLLLAAIVAAALTRVGLAVRDGDPSFQPEIAVPEALVATRVTTRSPAARGITGTDPTSRIFNAYFQFEELAWNTGVERRATETAHRHASRAAEELHLDPDQVSALSRSYSKARFSLIAPTAEDADEAERISSLIRQGLAS